jgi:hypothetical protein
MLQGSNVAGIKKNSGNKNRGHDSGHLDPGLTRTQPSYICIGNVRGCMDSGLTRTEMWAQSITQLRLGGKNDNRCYSVNHSRL